MPLIESAGRKLVANAVSSQNLSRFRTLWLGLPLGVNGENIFLVMTCDDRR